MSSLFGELAPELATWWRGAASLHVWFGSSAEPYVAARARAIGVPIVRSHRVERADAPEHASASYAHALSVDAPLVGPQLRGARMPTPYAWTAPIGERLIVHPGAGDPRKRWDRRGFEAVAHAWRRRGGEAVVLLGPAEADDVGAWRDLGFRVVDGLDVCGAAALLASAGLFVGNDAGVSHLASAVGCRGVVLFGPTRAERWRPLGGALVAITFRDRALAEVSDVVSRVLVARRCA